ncbi:MAG: hypothetical protein HS102_14445 [Planctomycetia bacterium]|nr:hypothetical protein [Planctomycetia bacterium]
MNRLTGERGKEWELSVRQRCSFRRVGVIRCADSYEWAAHRLTLMLLIVSAFTPACRRQASSAPAGSTHERTPESPGVVMDDRLRLTPSLLALGEVHHGVPLTFQVAITNDSPTPIHHITAYAPVPYLKVTLDRDRLEPGQSATATVILHTGAVIGDVDAVVRVASGHPEHVSAELRINGSVLCSMVLSAPGIWFNPGTPDATDQVIRVECDPLASLVVSGWEGDFFEAELTPVSPGIHQLTVRLREVTHVGLLRGSITLQNSDNIKRSRSIPVLAYLPDSVEADVPYIEFTRSRFVAAVNLRFRARSPDREVLASFDTTLLNVDIDNGYDGDGVTLYVRRAAEELRKTFTEIKVATDQGESLILPVRFADAE